MIGTKHFIIAFFILTSFFGKTQVEVFIDTVYGGVGSQVVVPVRANNFTDLVSMQGTVHFDPTVLTYTTVEQLGLPGLSVGSFGTTQASLGNITFSWYDGDLSGESISDSTVLFALRLTIIGSPGDSSLIWLDDLPTPLEFVDNGFNTISHVVDTGLVVVDGQPVASGLSLFADSLIANQNDTILVPVRVRDFNDIIGVQGTIGFDPLVADYITVEQFGVPGMDISNFGETQVNIGNLMFSWNSLSTSGENLADSAILFAIKYHVIGTGGSSTNVSFLGGPTPMEIVDSNLVVLNPYLAGGHIQVLADTNETFTLLIDTVVGMQTQLVNVPIRAWAFNEIISMQGTFAFDTSVISYSGVVNFGLPDLSLANFGTTQANNGLLSYSWFDQDLMGETYADSAVLFELVFQVDGDVGDFGYVISNSDLTPIEVVELGNIVIPYYVDSGGVIVDSLGIFISVVDPTDLHYCAGDSVGLIFEANMTPSPGNIYTLELSDETGDFTNSTVIGSLTSVLDSAVISGFMPSPVIMGAGYKLRVNSSLPNLIGIETSVNLTIEYYQDSVEAIVCFGDSIFASGTWQTVAGYYNDTLASMNGCDSLIITNLSFTTSIIDSVYLDVCQGDSLFLGGEWENTSGWYVDSLISLSGCDSLIRTNLNVLLVSITPISQTICLGDSIFLEGSWQNVQGIYIDTLTALNSCDSLISTTLNFYPSDTVDLVQTICSGDSLFLEGVWQTVTGNYTDVYTSISGCDSTVRTNLSVLIALEKFDTIALCFGDSLFVGGAWQSSTGDYIDSLLAISGCDSLIMSNLTISDLIIDTVYSAICAEDSLFLEGGWQNTTGFYTDSLLSINGCDSLIRTDLSVLNGITSSDAQTICAGDSLLIHGTYWSTAGIYFDTLPSQSGCDSIISFTLSVETNSLYSDSIQICTGDSIFLENAWQLVSGDYIDTLISNLGCDSIIRTNLDVLNSIQSFITESVCQGDSLFAEGAWQQAAGLYLDTLIAVAGCDSIISTTLNILLPTTGNNTLTICDGDSVLIDGLYQSLAGNYSEILVGSNGCDSIVDVLLVVNPTYFVQNTISICQGDSMLLEGIYQTSSGLYLDTTLTSSGCDSIVETNLTVNPTYFIQIPVNICQGDSIFLEGSFQTIAGIYLDTTLTTAGCDSITETTLTVNSSYFVQSPIIICQGDSILLEGGYQTTAGIYLDTVLTVNGCDSIVETNLTVNPSFFIQEIASICQGDSLFLDGAYQYATGIYLDVYLTSLGCDSTIETTLTVNPAPVFEDTVYICQGDSSLIHGNYESVAGNYLQTLQTGNGCDSIIDILLVVNPTHFIQTPVSICDGDSLFLEGSYQTTSGLYLDTVLTINGCDSIVETNLTMYPTASSNDAITICDGDSVLVNGNYLSVAGSYTDTLQTTNGCDSLITTVLSVTIIDPTVTVSSPTLTANYAGAQSYQWINCGSGNNIGTGTSQAYSAITNGSYQVLITDQGCDVLSTCYDILDVSIKEFNNDFIQIYPNPTFGNFKVDLGKEYHNVTLKVYSVIGQVIINDHYDSVDLIELEITEAPGSYIVEIQIEDLGISRVNLIKE